MSAVWVAVLLFACRFTEIVGPPCDTDGDCADAMECVPSDRAPYELRCHRLCEADDDCPLDRGPGGREEQAICDEGYCRDLHWR